MNDYIIYIDLDPHVEGVWDHQLGRGRVEGYEHDRVKHKDGEYVKYRADGEKVHTNELEGFWSYPKNAIKGVHRGVSDRHLQGYVNEYAFRQSHRNDGEEMFFTMLRQLVPVQRLAA